MIAFDWPVRVYYEDTDAGGVAYHATYLRWCERARTEWLRSLGHGQRELVDRERLLFTVASLQIDYRLPARLDDALCIRTEATGRGASVQFTQQVLHDNDCLALLQTRVACVDALTMRPRRLPDFLRKQLEP
ncbi:MAG: tol-pal system-associated acyl-CoA thioesterase [Pseudomonadota bacterium]